MSRNPALLSCLVMIPLLQARATPTGNARGPARAEQSTRSSDCGFISDPDLRAFCRQDCGFITESDLRSLCRGDCGFVSDSDMRGFCRRDCGFVGDGDLRSLCRSERPWPGKR